MDLAERLEAVNTTIDSLSLTANNSLAQLMQDQNTILSAWTELVRLNQTAEGVISNFTEAAVMIDPITNLISGINDTYLMLRNNLTALDMQADRLAIQLSMAMERAGNVSDDANSANTSLSSLLAEVEERGREAAYLFTLIGMLNESIQSLEMAADEANSRANTLMVRDEIQPQ